MMWVEPAIHSLGLLLTIAIPFYVVVVVGAWAVNRKFRLLRRELMDAGILPLESPEEFANKVHADQNPDEGTSNR